MRILRGMDNCVLNCQRLHVEGAHEGVNREGMGCPWVEGHRQGGCEICPTVTAVLAYFNFDFFIF